MKVIFLDTETTGLTAYNHGIIDLAMIIEIDGVEQEKVSIQCAPFPKDKVDKYALEIQNLTEAEIRARIDPKVAYDQLTAILSKYVDKYDKNDKFTLIGYNVQFDVDFLESFFKKNGDKFFGSWFNRRPMDVMSLAYYYRYKMGIELENWKLGTVCSHFGVPLVNAHTALPDAIATRELFYSIDGVL